MRGLVYKAWNGARGDATTQGTRVDATAAQDCVHGNETSHACTRRRNTVQDIAQARAEARDVDTLIEVP